MKKFALLFLALTALSGCAPSGHITGTYDPITGDVQAGVDIEIKPVLVETSPGKFERRYIQVPHPRVERVCP